MPDAGSCGSKLTVQQEVQKNVLSVWQREGDHA